MNVSASKVISKIQPLIVAMKDKTNKFGGYNYRTAEGILTAVKPLLVDTGAYINITDSLRVVADKLFVVSVASLAHEGGTSVSAQAMALHPASQKGMSDSQLTGSASTYARKYALCGLLGIGDSDIDPDAGNEKEENITIGKRRATELKELILSKEINEGKFLIYMGVKSLSKILATDFGKAKSAIDKKR